ncbi:zf-HC2 domain-containing protein [Streptomyces sp. YGL11-2]|uniref:zf-HC2 domain-containing protein n=1 Tax=Streptomyces sp. YGL11-2 TaxID=3414028 RepID=UPI003CF4C219
MLCSRIRTALSARLDGEELPPGITARGLDGHLADCPDCRAWDAQARALTAAIDRAAARAEGGGLRTRTGGAAPSDAGAPPSDGRAPSAGGTVVPLGDPAAVEALLARVRPAPAPDAAPVDTAGVRTD